MLKNFLIACFLLVSLPAAAQLSLGTEPPKVKAQMITEQEGIAPGKTLWVALRQEITPGWHTYWINPGDTGLATAIKWELPEGFTASALQFPTPQRQRIGDLVNYGYADSVMLMTQITAPANATGTATLKAKASWLVCKDICIPETGEYTIDLKVTDAPVDGPWASAFIAAKEKLPRGHKAQQSVKVNADTIELTLNPLPISAGELPEEVVFYPHDGLLIQHNADQKTLQSGRSLTITIPKNTTRSTPIETVSGDIWLRTVSGEQSFRFSAQVEAPKPVAVAPAPVPANKVDAQGVIAPEVETIGLAAALLSALIGGILLNLMPCVFPVLSLKALALVSKTQQKKRRTVLLSGAAYLAGVLTTFTVLGIILIILKNAGNQIGWGIQLQSPVFVAILALLLFFIGYVLSGAATIGTRLMGVGQALTQKTSMAGSFFTGALAVVVATPCTAPFMGGGIFYALTQNAAITLIVLWALGLGLALPYLLLTFFPEQLSKILPKPGIWMEHFKQFLTFPMIAAAIWLVWVLGQQAGADGVLHVLFAMLFLAFGLWLYGTTQNRDRTPWQIVKTILAILALILSVTLVVTQPKAPTTTSVATDANYEAFTPEKLNEARNANRPVFVNMTAAWCITCLANEKAALSSDKVKTYFKDNNILYLKGDWTNYDPAITAYLKEFSRSGVPIYVFYPAGKSPVVLPQLLTPDTVLENIQL